MSIKRTVFFVSDSTGITAETLGHALLTQFENLDVAEVRLPFVSDVEQAKRAVEVIEERGREDEERPIVFSTLTDDQVYDCIASSSALVLDLFRAFIRPLESEFERGSSHEPGRFHGLVNRASYEVRIHAVDFALSHDDGASTKHYSGADLILVGVSRSGKTPTCVYLAMQFGICAANYPLTEDGGLSDLPKTLHPHKSKLFGLSIDPERLHQIRSERRPNSPYASFAQCRKEVREAEALYKSCGIKFLDTSTASIEEIASRILQSADLRQRLY